jgi:hypothetical protein
MRRIVVRHRAALNWRVRPFPRDLTAVNGMPLLLRGRLAWAHDWVGNPALSAVFQALPARISWCSARQSRTMPRW